MSVDIQFQSHDTPEVRLEKLRRLSEAVSQRLATRTSTTSGSSATNYISYVFQRSETQPETPTGDTPAGWSYAPPADDGNSLWISSAEKTPAGVVVGVWSEPVNLCCGVAEGGAAAVYGALESSGPVAWVRAVDQTTWTPSDTTVDLDCTFYIGGAAVARVAHRITRDVDGLLTGAATVHSGGDLNLTRVTVTELNAGTLAMTVRFTYSHEGEVATITQAVTSALSGAVGADGSDGAPGTPGVDGVDGANGVDGADGADGADGLSVAELYIYRRATSVPTTPTGGSFNFSTLVLTPPGGWSASIPTGNDPVYISTGTASVVGTTGTDSTITWSSPVLSLQEGAAVDIVFQRASSQPATPSPSASTPAGWYTDVGSVPGGAGVIWSSVGTRANAGLDWTWQTPVKVEGEDGADGVDGTDGADGVDGEDGLTVSLSNQAFVVQCDSGGVPISGAFTNAVGQVTVYAGSTDVTSSATYSSTAFDCTGSVNTALNTPVTGAKGSYRVTAITGSTAYLQITVVYGGKTVVQRFNLAKSNAGAASSGGSDTSFGNVASGSYATIAGPIEIAVGPGGTMHTSVNHAYTINPSTTAGNHIATGKVQYREVGSGTWLDFSGASAVGSAAFYNSGDISWEEGALTIPDTSIAAPGTPEIYEFQYVAFRSSGSATMTPYSVFSTFNVWWAP